jgi:DNA methylase
LAEITLAVDDVQFVKELYPRVREDDAAIERYRAAIDRLPPITVARGRILVDGFHRWQAYKRERLDAIVADDLGNLTDVEILKESIRRNSSHGRQLETSDKKRMADLLYRKGTREHAELSELLSITEKTAQEYCRDARRDEKQAQQERAWDLWLDCLEPPEISVVIDVPRTTVIDWLTKIQSVGNSSEPPESRQHFDIWQFQKADGESSYFGKLPPQVVENLLWFYTEPGDIVVDPFAGGGTTIDVAKRMGRRVWASDRAPSTPTLPIHEHDITVGWPADAPSKANLIILDPPYWQQAKGRYSDDPADLGNMSLPEFGDAWQATVKACSAHLADGGRLAFIVSPTQLDDGQVIDHAPIMEGDCIVTGQLTKERRIIVPYQTQQATGRQVEWARENKRLLKLYRDLVVMSK